MLNNVMNLTFFLMKNNLPHNLNNKKFSKDVHEQ